LIQELYTGIFDFFFQQ